MLSFQLGFGARSAETCELIFRAFTDDRDSRIPGHKGHEAEG